MIGAELSNIWSCVSLPELLGGEKDLFDAHLQLRTNQPGDPAFLGFLGQPEQLTAKTVHAIRKAAESIQADGDTLVVVGSGGAYLAAKAGIELLDAGRNLREKRLRLYFAGDHLSGRRWLRLCELLDGRSFSLHLICPEENTVEVFLASRALRWMLERRYGKDAKNRIYVSAPAESAMATMAQEEGYTFLPLPSDPGGTHSALSSAALLPMAVCGIDPLDVLEGAAEGYENYDLRAFENPVWMYAGARNALSARGRTAELLCSFEPALSAFGDWWRNLFLRCTCRDGAGLLPLYAAYPAELNVWDAALTTARTPVFETLLRFPPETQKVNIEMDWKDYDGLGYLSERTLGDVQQAADAGLCEAHDEQSAPMIQLECERLSAEMLGELFYFFELAAALCAVSSGLDPFEPAPAPSREAAERELGKPDAS